MTDVAQEPLPLAGGRQPAVLLLWCTYCADQHQAERGLGMDPRYAMGRCEGDLRPLVADRDKARDLAQTVGKYRPKGTPLGKGLAGAHYVIDAAGNRVRP